MKKKKLTLKQRAWIRAYSTMGTDTFGNATQSAIKAYNLDPEKQYEAAANIGWENLRKLDLEITELMDEMGLTDTYLMNKLNEGLEAEKPYGKDGVLHSDNTARIKALELGLKLRNKLKDRVEVSGSIFNQPKMKVEVVDDSKDEPETAQDNPAS